MPVAIHRISLHLHHEARHTIGLYLTSYFIQCTSLALQLDAVPSSEIVPALLLTLRCRLPAEPHTWEDAVEQYLPSIIKIVSFTTIHCNSQWWPPSESLSGVANSSLFLLLSACTLYNFLNSLYIGPGFLPLGWRPEDESHCEYLQKCNVCQGYKAPRSHHCKKCKRCVLKMDHHCPWINACVGHQNHSNFTLFLFFAVCGCSQATVILACSIYRALYRNWYLYHGTGTEPVVVLGFATFILSVFALGLAIGVVLAVGMLLYFQLRAIVRNRTGVEDWILSKANYRRQVAEIQGEKLEPFIFPYHLGTWENIRQVLNSTMTPAGNGIWWKVAPSCDQYTLTIEQKAQKIEKKLRSRPYTCVKAYSGHIFPLVHGVKVLCSPPCSDDPRLSLALSDVVVVTRFARHWFFGEKRLYNEDGEDIAGGRGWFPKCCVIPLETRYDGSDSGDSSAKKIN